MCLMEQSVLLSLSSLCICSSPNSRKHKKTANNVEIIHFHQLWHILILLFWTRSQWKSLRRTWEIHHRGSPMLPHPPPEHTVHHMDGYVMAHTKSPCLTNKKTTTTINPPTTSGLKSLLSLTQLFVSCHFFPTYLLNHTVHFTGQLRAQPCALLLPGARRAHFLHDLLQMEGGEPHSAYQRDVKHSGGYESEAAPRPRWPLRSGATHPVTAAAAAAADLRAFLGILLAGCGALLPGAALVSVFRSHLQCVGELAEIECDVLVGVWVSVGLFFSFLFSFLQSWMEDVSSPGPQAGAAAYQGARRVFPRGSVRRGMRMGAVPCSPASARIQVWRLLKQHETMNYFSCSYTIVDWVFHFHTRSQIQHFIFIFHPNKQEGRFCWSVSVAPLLSFLHKLLKWN